MNQRQTYVICSVPGDDERGIPTVYGIVGPSKRGLTDRDFATFEEAVKALRSAQ